MIVTEPDSNAENVEDMTSYHITLEEMDWRQSMLSITEAYVDGSSFRGEELYDQLQGPCDSEWRRCTCIFE